MSNASLRSFEYLEQLPGRVFQRLYEQPSTALAIFRRMLTHLAKTFVMAMLYISQPMPMADLDSWLRPGAKRERDHALSLLERLHILRAVANPGKPRAYLLTDTFAKSMRQALTGGGNHKSFGVACNTPERDRVGIETLDGYARCRWEALLGYMVGGAAGGAVMDKSDRVSDGVIKLLQDGELVKLRGRHVDITQEGFAFVLQEVNAQVWAILLLYLNAAEDMNMDAVDVLSFLFMLGSLELGQDYSKANLSATQLQMLEDLSDFGIVYGDSASAQRFYPTRLATTLTSDASALLGSTVTRDNSTTLFGTTEGNGYIIVETNYRVYAYTTSPLQIAILQLFARLSTRYPNMIAGKITRESIRRAVAMGITSEQIISYLTTHAHPQMRKNNPVMPPTVVDQIRLWQIEGERMKATSGFLFKEFASHADYERTYTYAEEIGVLVWKRDEKRSFFVTRHEQVAVFIKSRQKQNSAQQ